MPKAAPTHSQRKLSKPAQYPRASAAKRGYGRCWRRASKRFLSQNPLCAVDLAAGRTVAATQVDHIVPHEGDMTLFWNRDNWQSLCAGCHSSKTRKESRV